MLTRFVHTAQLFDCIISVFGVPRQHTYHLRKHLGTINQLCKLELYAYTYIYSRILVIKIEELKGSSATVKHSLSNLKAYSSPSIQIHVLV